MSCNKTSKKQALIVKMMPFMSVFLVIFSCTWRNYETFWPTNTSNQIPPKYNLLPTSKQFQYALSNSNILICAPRNIFSRNPLRRRTNINHIIVQPIHETLYSVDLSENRCLLLDSRYNLHVSDNRTRLGRLVSKYNDIILSIMDVSR